MPSIATGRAAAIRGDALSTPWSGITAVRSNWLVECPCRLGPRVAMEWSPPWCHLMVQSSRAVIFGHRSTAVNTCIQIRLGHPPRTASPAGGNGGPALARSGGYIADVRP
jgi:hypothetical protein